MKIVFYAGVPAENGIGNRWPIGTMEIEICAHVHREKGLFGSSSKCYLNSNKPTFAIWIK